MYGIIKNENGYRITYKGFEMGGYYATKKEAADQISQWTGKPWAEKPIERVSFVPEMYGSDSDYPVGNDNNDQGEPI